MKSMTEKALFLALFALAAMNLVALLAKTGAAQSGSGSGGIYQIACYGGVAGRDGGGCEVLNTATGKVISQDGQNWNGSPSQ